MDADGNIIPIVEDDQGEGFKDELPPEAFLIEDRFDRAIEDIVLQTEGPNRPTFEEIVKQRQQEVKPKPPPRASAKMKMQKGMPIDFMGYRYKVISVKRNNKGETVKLRLKGEWK